LLISTLCCCCASHVSGNTGFPLMMRLIIYTLWRMPFLKCVAACSSCCCLLPYLSNLCSPQHGHVFNVSRKYRHVYRFMLDHPRRCYTHLFPAAETRYVPQARRLGMGAKLKPPHCRDGTGGSCLC
jgi:hypothetical protein